jgi:hypothetical protein
MQLGKLILASALTLSLASCATGYQPSGAMGGFVERPISPDTYYVEFSGNGFTNPQRASDFMLLRCAEIALENGYSHFAILQAVDASTVSYSTTPIRSTTTASANGYMLGNNINLNGSSTTITQGGDTTAIFKPGAGATIRLLRQPDSQAFDAQRIKDSLRAKYKLD